GQSGPGSARPAYAPIVQAMSGFEMVTLAAQAGLERPLNMGLPVGDTCAAQQAFGAICAALYYRARTGIGQYIDIAMFDSLLATMHRDFQTAFHADAIERRYGPIAARDGYLMVMPLSQRQFVDLCGVIGRADLLDDARFATMRARFDHYNALMDIAEDWSRTRTAHAAVRALEAAGIPCTIYRDILAASEDAQLHHRGMLTEVVDAAGPLKVPNTPFLYSATHAAVRPEVATLGQHTRGVLSDELGLPAADIEALAAAGVIAAS
ncbi:MAG: CoA transferase, partial [Gammaproteobacteria bacterium]